jgi:predicted TPR repeat methyltransferase
VWDYGLDQFKSSLPTRVAFLSRFTVAELVAIRASTDQVVKDIMSRIDVLRYINLQEQLTVDSVAYFAQVGLIAPERAAEVTA